MIYYNRSAINIQSCETNAIETLQNIKQFSLHEFIFLLERRITFIYVVETKTKATHMLDKHSIVEIGPQSESTYL